MRLFAILSALFVMQITYAQSGREWEEYLAGLMNAEDYTDEAISEIYDMLCDLEESPLNINAVSYDEIAQIPGLDLGRVSDIIEFRDRYGELKTIEELAMIPSIDHDLRLFLSHFLVAEPIERVKWYSKEGLTGVRKVHHGNVIGTMDIPLYTRNGYKTIGETGEKAYLGDKYKYGIRYTGRLAKYVKYGIVGAKDAGEPFFKGKNSDGMDYYSYFVSVQDMGRMKNLVLGSYRLRFGMGLVINTNSSYGKQTALSNMNTVTNMITGHSSRSDVPRLQGAATTFDVGRKGSESKMELSAFYSYRSVDATLNTDGSVSTILTSGYHRTESEMGKKYNTKQMVYGGHFAWKRKGWHTGVTAVFDWFNRDLNPSWDSEGTKYRKYYAHGNSFWNVGVDYGYLSPRLSFTGETATGGCGAIATLNALQAKLSERFSLTAIQRFYSYEYFAIQSNSFSDGGRVQNESGIYLGARWNLAKYAVLDVYSDMSYSPWLKYLVRSSSHSFDNNIQLTYSKERWEASGRYRFKMRERDNNDKTALADRDEHRLRAYVEYDGEMLSLKTQADACLISFEGDSSRGWMLGETVGLSFNEKMNVSANVSYFDTDDYNSRLYTYEKSMLYTFSMPSYYGNGMRLSCVVRMNFSKHWMAMAKVGYTKYFDRSSIGTSYQTLEASHLTDIGLQMRYQF